MSAPAAQPKKTGKPKILVVEDDDQLLRMLSKMLGQMADVVTAANGVAALAAIEQSGIPDLILTDVMMPEMDGMALVKHLKADARYTKIPIVMLTAKDGPRDVVAGINAGVRGYLTKPFKHEELLAKIKKYLPK